MGLKMKMMGRSLPLAICAAAALSFAPAISQAAIIETFLLTSDHCTGGCLTNQTNGGTITVTDNGTGTLQFDIELANGNRFVQTGLDLTVGFQLGAGVGAILYTGVPATWSIPGGNPQSPGVFHEDGTGDFNHGLIWGGGSGGGNADGSSLIFTIAAAGLDITDLVQNAAGQFFGIDIISGTTGLTGAIDASTGNRTETPEPTPLVLLAMGMLALGFVRRSKQ